MASPFKIFRKHQKVLLAVVLLLCMFSFVFAQYIFDIMGLRRGQNPVVATCSYGKLTEVDVQNMVRQHGQLLTILQEADFMASNMPYAPEEYKRQKHMELQMLFGAETEQSVIETWLLAQRAKQMGLQVDKQTINDFLRMFTNDKLDAKTWNSLMSRGMTQRTFFYAMEDTLLAFYLKQMFVLGKDLVATTPEQRWNMFTRVMRQASVELVPVSVDGYVGSVADPDKKTVEKFFNEHKADYNRPDSSTPGFREPYKTEVHYFKADLRAFTDAMVTDQDVMDSYEKNKEQIDRLDAERKKSSDDAKKALDKLDALKTGETKTTNEKNTEEKNTEEKTSVKPEAKPAEPAAPSPDKPATDKPADDNGEKPSASAAKSDESSAVGRSSPFMFASAEKTSDTTAPAADTPDKPKDASATAASAEASKPEEQPKAASETAASEKPKDADKVELPAAATSAETAKADEKSEEKPDEHPSEASKKQIRDELGEIKLQETLNRLDLQLKEYSRKLAVYNAELINNPNAKPPKPLDFDALAKENHLTLGETKLMSKWEAADLEISKSITSDGASFIDYVFRAARVPLYFPARSGIRELLGSNTVYLFWKVKEVKESTPSLDDKPVYDEAVAKWKAVQARELAKKAAKALADKVAGDKPLQDALPDQKVISPAPFTWEGWGSVPAKQAMITSREQPRLSKVEGVDMPGENFMREVFSLSPGKVGVTMNQPETVAYVVRLVEFSPSDDSLWADFESYPFRFYARVGAAEQLKLNDDWLKEIKTDANFKLERQLDRQTDSSTTEDN
jgi:hypothetical protein